MVSSFTFGNVNKLNGGIVVFYYNYVNQCNKKGLSPSAAAEAMGFKRSMVTRWKDGSAPRMATLQRMADFFQCSVEELTEETKKSPSEDGVTEEQIKFALAGDAGRVLTDEDMEKIRAFAAFTAQERGKK